MANEPMVGLFKVAHCGDAESTRMIAYPVPYTEDDVRRLAEMLACGYGVMLSMVELRKRFPDGVSTAMAKERLAPFRSLLDGGK